MVKYTNKTGAAQKIVEIKVLADTILQDGESVMLNPETSEIIALPAPAP